MLRKKNYPELEGQPQSLTPEPERGALSPSILVQSPAYSPGGKTVWQNLHPKDRFRASVHKVISIHRRLSMLTTSDNRTYVGAEPGVDPRQLLAEATYRDTLTGPCKIEIVDYSAIRNTHRVMNNDEFIAYMNTATAGSPPTKPPWAKVRWINICGLSWEVIKTVSIKYGMPLLFFIVSLGTAFFCNLQGNNR